MSAASAKTMALSSAMFGAVISGIVKGYQTGDVEEALEAAALGATEGFKIENKGTLPLRYNFSLNFANA